MKEKLYKILPHFLQNALVTLFNVLAYRKRYGGDYKKFRKEKLQNRGLSLTELKAYQAQRYKHLIDFAIKNSAYYQKTLGNIPNASAIENIKHLPIVNKVKFLGLLDIEDVNKYLEKIDIYIQPSRTEGLSRALVEAMSRGCFCIASKVGGNPELIEEKYLYNVNNPKSIVKIIKALNQNTITKSSQRNYEYSKKFEPNILRNKLEEFYNKILKDLGR